MPSSRLVAPAPVAAGVRDLPAAWVVAVLVVSRALIALEWVIGQNGEVGDVVYYWSRASMILENGFAETLREYPTPMAALLVVPRLLAGPELGGFVAAFVTLILLTDLALCGLLWWSRAPYRGWAIATWSVLCALVGPLVWLRMDLIPAVLVGAAIVLATRRPGVAGVLLAIGTACKLWPAVLLPLLLLGRAPDRRRVTRAALIGYAGTGVVVVAASVLAGGWARLVSPLVWQSDRGLQIESIPASVLMAQRAIDPGQWSVLLSRYQAFEIFGPGVDAWLVIADLLSVAAVVCGIAVIVAHARRRYDSDEAWRVAVAIGMLALILLLIVSNKTLSPQYVVWLAGPLAALVALRGPGVRPIRGWLVLAALATGLTHLVYPVLYDFVNGLGDDPIGSPIAVTVLVARNVILLAMTVSLLRAAVRPAA